MTTRLAALCMPPAPLALTGVFQAWPAVHRSTLRSGAARDQAGWDEGANDIHILGQFCSHMCERGAPHEPSREGWLVKTI